MTGAKLEACPWCNEIPNRCVTSATLDIQACARACACGASGPLRRNWDEANAEWNRVAELAGIDRTLSDMDAVWDARIADAKAALGADGMEELRKRVCHPESHDVFAEVFSRASTHAALIAVAKAAGPVCERLNHHESCDTLDGFASKPCNCGLNDLSKSLADARAAKVIP